MLSDKPSIEQLRWIMSRLRDPETGCPWDTKQTFSSISPYTIEEAYEVADAIESNDMVALKDELGDLLFQVVFYAQMAKEQGAFDFEDIVVGLNEKLIRRHPHVFDKQEQLTDTQLEVQWQAIKAQERAKKKSSTAGEPLWHDIPKMLPALSRAQKIQKRASALGFDWPDYHGALDKVTEEVQEVSEALSIDPHSAHSAEELGDLLFATVNVARHAKHDPEQILRLACDKFVRRFERVESTLHQQGLSLGNASLEEMDLAWEQVKKQQSS
ncbi:nucleoside triphosphate pyrophosphohydrolase [Pseudoalteromonas byunsanensis]|uniref:Nucleoside triphosphate pyrophosphohydrolase n=1 Tax=Pseudoalteromonas byunsanensis TaxID=327939 RepID=A0A1S1N6U7_9GAMM|nr:nucleoside triphosphate pyrophosphohydrolase [Pseudoalteromonas byunsanensis]OHU95737.1 nucleoside triphosphate pyrophosphohydrolase [Pseudoalteromonas byunsanensis]